jgi:hypothetical protein
MRAATEKDVEVYFPILEKLLKEQKLPCEHGPARFVDVNEFMLMSVGHCTNEAHFKHRDTRNYVIVYRRYIGEWVLNVPMTTDAFHLGFFDKFPDPADTPVIIKVEPEEWLDHSPDCCCGHQDCPGSHPEVVHFDPPQIGEP